jgi:DNA-binding response OmpR family regulator
MAEKKRILAVDDDVPAVSALKQILAQRGYEVQTASGGEDALALIEQGSYDLFILDVNMPGVNGIEVCRKIRENARTADTPVIFLTAKGLLGDMLEGKEAGSDLYLVKPVLAAKILSMVGMFLSSDGPLAKKPKRATTTS